MNRDCHGDVFDRHGKTWGRCFRDSTIFEMTGPIDRCRGLATDGSYALRHELGHVLGLPHSSDPGDIMYPSAPPCL